MSNDESEFVKNTLRICQEIQNRFYSERIKLGDVDPEEPWWLSKLRILRQMPNWLFRIIGLLQIGRMTLKTAELP